MLLDEIRSEINNLKQKSDELGLVLKIEDKKKELGKAIGKEASGVKKLRQKLRLNVELFEYADTAEEFIKKALYNSKVKEVKACENILYS